MAVRHAGAPVTDRDFWEAARQGGDKRLAELFDPMNSGGAFRGDCVQCRLYPRLFCDGEKYYAEVQDADSSVAAVA